MPLDPKHYPVLFQVPGGDLDMESTMKEAIAAATTTGQDDVPIKIRVHPMVYFVDDQTYNSLRKVVWGIECTPAQALKFRADLHVFMLGWTKKMQGFQ